MCEFRFRRSRHVGHTPIGRPGLVKRFASKPWRQHRTTGRIHHRPVRDRPCLSFHFTRPPCIQSENDAKISSMRVLLPARESSDTSLLRIWGVTGIPPGDGLGRASKTRQESLRSIFSLRAASLAGRVTHFVPTSIENAQRRSLTMWKLLYQGTDQRRKLLSSQIMILPYAAKSTAPKIRIV